MRNADSTSKGPGALCVRSVMFGDYPKGEASCELCTYKTSNERKFEISDLVRQKIGSTRRAAFQQAKKGSETTKAIHQAIVHSRPSAASSRPSHTLLEALAVSSASISHLNCTQIIPNDPWKHESRLNADKSTKIPLLECNKSDQILDASSNSCYNQSTS